MMRIFLFAVTNIAILLVVSIVFRLLGLEGILHQNGVDLNLGSLLVFSAVIGMTGSIISLLLSKWMAIRGTGAHVIKEPANDTEAWLVRTVQHQAQAAGIGMPQVAIFPSDAPNAFATGARRDAALVAVSTGLLQRMDRQQVEAVLGHEVSHVANGDMVTLALIQGVLNTFVIFLSRVIGHVVDRVILRNERDGHGIGFFITTIAAQLLLGILATMIVCWFSRRREFRADAGGARLAGRPAMIGALERLKTPEPHPLPDGLRAFGIRDGGGFSRLFMTHPPLEERIATLQSMTGA
ncbi:MAG TPA: protease HtpX [Myxococcota bacterium]|nr:protease HtpX [Myxococcota bacterium]